MPNNKQNKPKKGKKQGKPKQSKQLNKQINQLNTAVNKVKQVTGIGKALRAVGGIAGAYFGAPGLGKSLGSGISRIMGQGDYKVQNNSLMSGGPPSFAALGTGIRFVHREYLADVISSTGYSVNTYRIQPNIPKTFPWLSQIANSFEQYKVNGMVVNLNTTSGNAISSTNNALGVWGVTTVYDPTRPPLANKISAEEYMGCTAGVPSISLLHAIECKPKTDVLERYYVDYTQTVTGEDLKFYDHGLINVFTQGQQQAGIALGELWISYDVTMYNPRIQPVGEEATADHYRITGASVTATNPCGTGGTVNPNTGSGMNGTIVTGGSGYGVLTIPAGTSTGLYQVIYAVSNPTGVAGFKVAIDSSNLSTNLTLPSGYFPTTIFDAGPSGTATTYICASVFRKSDINAATLRLGTPATNIMPAGNAATILDVYVIPLGSALTSPGDEISKLSRNDFDKIYDTLISYFKTNYKLEILTNPLGVVPSRETSFLMDEETKE